MGSAAIRTKLALRMANASACSARMRSLTLAIRAATVSTRPLIASARRGAAEDTSGMDATRISSSWLSRSMCAVRSVCAPAQDATFLSHSRTAGALSASGMQFSNIVTEAGASALTQSENFDFEGVNNALTRINSELEKFADRLRSRGVEHIQKRYFVEARYRFQVWELEIPVAKDRFEDDEDVAALVAEFHRVHERVFAVQDIGQAVECLNWRGRLTADVNAPALEPSRDPQQVTAAPERNRPAYFSDGLVDTPIFVGEQLGIGNLVSGPAIIEEPTTTLVVYPGSTARVSAGGRYILTPPQEVKL